MKVLISWYENLTIETLEEIDNFYANDCYFRDPFNKLHNLQDIKKLYQKMFRHLSQPKFKIIHVLREGELVSLYWEFDFIFLKKTFKIFGNTLLRLNSDNKIIEHIDYWDSVQEWWIKLPLIGAILRMFL